MIDVNTIVEKSLEEYLALEYPFNVLVDPDGGYVVVFPDLPGCMTQADSYEEIVIMAQDARTLWIETAYDEGIDIPMPSYPEDYSGKFNVRLPRSVHRKLAESAERENISLNQYVNTVLANGDTQRAIEQRFASIEAHLASIAGRLRFSVESGKPTRVPRRNDFRLVDDEYEQAS